MPRSLDLKCPICGNDRWFTILRTHDFDLDQCAERCIVRTVPSPKYTPDLPADATVENLLNDQDSGRFSLAKEILDLVGEIRPSGKLLDIGSDWGHLLKLAGDRGYDGVGLEASLGVADLSRQAFGVDVIEGSFPEHKFDPGTFDIVVMNHLIEHIEDPVRALSEAQRILKPAGILAVGVPNFESLMSRVKAERWQGIQPSQHVWQLSADALGMLLQEVGLTAILIHYGRLDYRRGSASLPKWLMLRMILGLADILKMGDNLIMIARKPFSRPTEGRCA